MSQECSGVVTIHSRVSGYYTGDVYNTWNNGKKKEFTCRKHLSLSDLLLLQGTHNRELVPV